MTRSPKQPGIRWQAAAHYELACIDCCRADYESALDHLNRSLETNSGHLKARDLKAYVLAAIGRGDEASALVESTHRAGPTRLLVAIRGRDACRQ